MLNRILFCIVVLLTNIIQGITGFAGTILAMPPGLMLVGYDMAKPVLNVLAILSSVYIFIGNYKRVNWKELIKIVIVMSLGIFGSIFIKKYFYGKETLLYRLLGIFVILLAAQGLWSLSRPLPQEPEQNEPEVGRGSPYGYLILALAGIVHGLFVSGGPLLIGYASKRIQDKVSFRATISTVWIFLNTLILLDDVQAGLWTSPTLLMLALSIPFLFAGVYIGSKLCAKMSRLAFMKLTDVLLLISGVSLLAK